MNTRTMMARSHLSRPSWTAIRYRPSSGVAPAARSYFDSLKNKTSPTRERSFYLPNRRIHESAYFLGNAPLHFRKSTTKSKPAVSHYYGGHRCRGGAVLDCVAEALTVSRIPRPLQA